MKNLSLGLLALFFCVSSLHSEVIDAVLFNPSRLGRYEDLKVSAELNAPGGVLVKESSTVQSKNSVTVTSPEYELTKVSGQKVALPNAQFNTKTFTVRGGSAGFSSGQIQELKDAAGKMIRVKGDTVNVSGNVRVNMAGGTDVSGTVVRGLRLGGNDIPQPKEGCEELGWYAYRTTSGKEYKVLGFKKCPGEEEETCPAGKVYDKELKECLCEADFYSTPEFNECWGSMTCDDGTESEQIWDNDTCSCKNDCRPKADGEYHLVCDRISYTTASLLLGDGAWGKEEARRECEFFGNINAVGYEAHDAIREIVCPPDSGGSISASCTEKEKVSAWGAVWKCQKGPVSCVNGIGVLNRCTCLYGVG